MPKPVSIKERSKRYYTMGHEQLMERYLIISLRM